MAHCRLIDFDITIHGQQAPYLVHATYRQHTATGQFAADATHPAWSQLDRLAQGRTPAGRQHLEEIGAQLYALLFQGQVRDLWLQARAELDAGATGVCIRLMTQPPAVTALPWEAMFDPERNVAFAGSLQTPLVRAERQLQHVGRVRTLAATPPLRLLIATPEDPTEQIDGAAEVQQLTTALGALAGHFVEITVLDGRFDVVTLRQKIAEVQPDILHLVTHGQPDGVLLWQQGVPMIAPAAALRVALEDAHSVKLIFLNACATAQGILHHGLASLGAHLLQTGVPAVIAMQYDIEENTASDFARFFYQELFSGRCPGVVPRAVSFARSNLYALNPDNIGYSTPVLWLNAIDGTIFEMEWLSMSSFTTHHPVTPAHEPDFKPLKRQRRAVEEWYADVVLLSSASLPVALRATLQRPLQDALHEIDDLLVQLRGLDQEAPTDHIYKQYEEKLARVIALQNTVNRLAAVIRQQQERLH